MKILVITNLFPPHYVGGYELICQTVVETLRSRGHEIEVLTSNHEVSSAQITSETGIHRVLKIHGMFGHPWLHIRQLQHLERSNNESLKAILERFSPDLVYCWNFSGLSKSMLFTLQNSKVPTVFAVCDHWIARSHESDVWLCWWNKKNSSARHRLVRAFWTANGFRRRCHSFAPTNPIEELRFPRIHFCSHSLRDFTMTAGFAVKHGAVIYCPVNTERFNGPPKDGEGNLQRLLYVGRLNEDKGVMTALRALANLRGKFHGQLSVFGRGNPDYEAELNSFAQKEKLPVTFASISCPEQMPAIYRAHDALLFTSEWPEPFALTPLEAMASGLPVIGTTTGGSIELFRNRKNALTYTAGNFEELAQRILELNRDSKLRTQLAQTAQQEVRCRYAEPIIIDQIENYLEESLKKWEPMDAF